MVQQTLHMAKSMAELEAMADISPIFMNKTVIQLCKSAVTVASEAEKKLREGDEESSFVLFMKYFSLMDMIKKKGCKDKKQIREYLGSNDLICSRLDKLEHLKASLMSRYQKRDDDAYKQSRQSLKNISNSQATSSGPAPESKTSKSLSSKTISCEELYKHLKDKKNDILIMDCRSRDDYTATRIDYKSILNIPEKVLRNGLSANKLASYLDEDAKRLWSQRGQMDWIILVDWKSSGENWDPAISALRGILLNWDPDVPYENPPRVLSGGYETFMIMYPMCTTDPHYQYKSSNEPKNPDVNAIEYPNIFDIKMKDDHRSEKPTIDRSSKFAAEAKFSRKPIDEIFAESEIILDQKLKKEGEALNIENQIQYCIEQAAVTNDDEKKQHYLAKQSELAYQLYEKESEINDTTIQQQELDEQIEEMPGEEQAKIKNAEAERIKAKRQAALKLEEDRKRKQEDLQRKLRAGEEHRRLLQLKEEEEAKRPKIPSIDRSVKPSNHVSAQQQVVQRNFTPQLGSYGDVGATGLQNLGNTCYMNSIIQCLLNLEEFCKYFKSNFYKKHLNRKSQTNGEIAEELAHLCHELWCGKYKNVAPRDLRAAIGRYQPAFRSYTQQDSHEFLTILLDLLHSELQFAVDQNVSVEKLSKGEAAWREFVKNQNSIVQKHFFGQIRSTVKCKACLYESSTYEGFSNLSLELPQAGRQCNLNDCLALYFDGEAISGWHCPQCKASRDAVKKLDISKLPDVLVIHLKRFVCLNMEGTAFKKNQDFVRFPVERFNISDYILPSVRKNIPQSSTYYNLCAVSNHYGTMERGHYTAFCKNYKTENWYKFDDNYVTQIPSSEVNSSAAYILFYANPS